MTQSPVNTSEHKKLLKDECCDLYGEFCYPCNINVAETPAKVGDKQRRKKKPNAE